MWYAARLLFESIKTDVPDQPVEEAEEELLEEDIFLIQADDDEGALKAACDIGYKQEHSYPNVYGQTVTWRFIAVADLKELMTDKISHGTEVYYRFIDKKDVGNSARWSRPER